MCGGRSSILHYGPLIETNYLYAPTPNGQRPECVAKQKQYPPPDAEWECPSASLNKHNTPTHWWSCVSFVSSLESRMSDFEH